MVTVQARKLSLRDVHQRLGYQQLIAQSFQPWLELQPLDADEQQQLEQIRSNFQRHLLDRQVLEGQVRLLAIAQLLQLSGFYQAPIQLLVEAAIETIQIPDQDLAITGRLDLVAVNPRATIADGADFWILVVESKESQIDALAGLPQSLTYAYNSLQYQSAVWGLVTNGVSYRFVLIEAGETPVYRLMPELNLIDVDRALQLVQVLQAIAQKLSTSIGV